MKDISSVLVITWEVTWGCPQTSGFISNRGKSSASQFECNHQDNILQDSVKEGAVGKPSDSLGCLAQTGTQLAWVRASSTKRMSSWGNITSCPLHSLLQTSLSDLKPSTHSASPFLDTLLPLPPFSWNHSTSKTQFFSQNSFLKNWAQYTDSP